MAKIPFIQEQVTTAAPTGGSRVDLGSDFVGRALESAADSAFNIANEIAKKRKNDQLLEERVARGEFELEETKRLIEQAEQATTTEEIETLESRYQEGFDERFNQFFGDRLKVEEGSDRAERIRLAYDAAEGIRVKKSAYVQVSKRSADLFLNNLEKSVDDRAKALQLNPQLFESYVNSPPITDGLERPTGMDKATFNDIAKNEHRKYAMVAGSSIIDDAVTVHELDEFEKVLRDSDSLYHQKLDQQGLDKLLDSIDTRRKGLAAKSDKELSDYIRARGSGASKFNATMASRAEAVGRTEELELAERAAENLKNLAKTPKDWARIREENKAIIENVSPEAAPVALSTAAKIENQISHLERQLNDDPHGYALRYNENLTEKQDKIHELIQEEGAGAEVIRLQQELVSESDAYQASIGVPLHKRRITTKNDPVRDILQASVATENPAQTIVDNAELAKAVYGPYFDRWLSEVGDDLPPGIMPVIMAETEFGRRLAASHAGMTDKDLQDALSEKVGEEPSIINERIDSALSKKAADIFASHQTEINGTQRAARNVNMIRRHAKMLLVAGRETDEAKAVDTAYNEFYSSVVHVPVGGNVVRIPTAVNPDSIKAGLDAIALDPTILSVDTIPLGDQLEGESIADHARRQKREMRENLVIKNSADMSRYEFYLQGPRGLLPLLDANTLQPKTMTPEEIEDIASFKGLQSRPADKAERARRAAMGAM